MSKVEEWRPILEIPENRYFISNLGRVKNNKGTIMKHNISDTGYHSIHLKYKGKRVIKKVHRLVLEYFLYSSNLEVNHKDGNKDNNVISNLEYTSRSENMLHAVKNGLHKNSSLRGEKHNASKYTFLDIESIRNMYKNGVKMKEIANKLGCSTGYVSDVVNFKIRINE